MRLSSLPLLVVALTIFWPASYSWGRGVALPAGVLKQVAAVLTTGMLTVAPLSAEDDPAWTKVRNRSQPHHASTFYLLVNAGDNGWRVMHTELVDLNNDGEPLLLGMRIYIIGGEGIGRVNKQGEGLPLIGLAEIEMTLISNRGVVERNAEVEEVAHFKHPAGKSYDQTLLTVKDVDFSKYTPITIAPYPSAGTELEMLSYRVDRENKLRFMTYPLRRRDCQALAFDAEASVGDNTCVTAEDAFSIIGAPYLYQGRRDVGCVLLR